MPNFFLGAEQTIFSNPDALDPDFVPKLLPHREEQQKYIATAVRPILFDRPGKHLIITGASGIGKTVATRRVILDLDEVEQADEISRVYLNCWKANTAYKVAVEISHQIGYKFTQNMKTNEIFNKITELMEKKKGLVLVLDEIDKAEEYDFIYFILESVKKLALIMITNVPNWGSKLDDRIKSRLVPEKIEFKPYTPSETEDILRERLKYAFYEGTWDDPAFKRIAEQASRYQDIRVGIMLLKAAGEAAEEDSSQKVQMQHAETAVSRTQEFKIKSSDDLTDEEKAILEVCRKNDKKTTGELYELYRLAGGNKSDKTFYRYLERLQNRRLVELNLTGEGFKGRSTLIKFKGFEKKLSEF